MINLTAEQIRINNQALAAHLPASLVTDLRRKAQTELQLMEYLTEAVREQADFNDK